MTLNFIEKHIILIDSPISDAIYIYIFHLSVLGNVEIWQYHKHKERMIYTNKHAYNDTLNILTRDMLMYVTIPLI